jgi:hypothetical protein
VSLCVISEVSSGAQPSNSSTTRAVTAAASVGSTSASQSRGLSSWAYVCSVPPSSHVFQAFVGTLDEAGEALDRAALFIRQRLVSR